MPDSLSRPLTSASTLSIVARVVTPWAIATVTALLLLDWCSLAADRAKWRRRREGRGGARESVSRLIDSFIDRSSEQPRSSDGFRGAIGRTPLVRLSGLSAETGCEILGKCEFLNPGGSVKDRVANRLIDEALERGQLKAGGWVTEATAGSTGISLTLACHARGLRTAVVLPDDVAAEKAALLNALQAEVHLVRPVSFSHPEHPVRVAERLAKERGGLFANQFENLANFRVHYEETAAEIWEQTGGKLTAFVCGAGTGGTIAGCGKRFKEASQGTVQVYLADVQGSSLFNKVMRGVAFHRVEREGTRSRHPQDTITEGVGLNRVTKNFSEAVGVIDGAFQVADSEALAMLRRLLREDGLFLGSSSGVNCTAALKLARQLGPGNVIVTILCDSGERYVSKLYNDNNNNSGRGGGE